MAASRDGLRESSVVTKTFFVEEIAQVNNIEEKLLEDKQVYIHVHA